MRWSVCARVLRCLMLPIRPRRSRSAMSRAITSIWRDVKVFQRYDAAADRWRAYAYVGVDAGGRLSVVDLTGLPNRVSSSRVRMTQASLHNVFVSNVDYAFGAPAYENGTPLLHVLGGPGALQPRCLPLLRPGRSAASRPGGRIVDWLQPRRRFVPCLRLAGPGLRWCRRLLRRPGRLQRGHLRGLGSHRPCQSEAA